jgi:hypothetical protein
MLRSTLAPRAVCAERKSLMNTPQSEQNKLPETVQNGESPCSKVYCPARFGDGKPRLFRA